MTINKHCSSACIPNTQLLAHLFEVDVQRKRTSCLVVNKNGSLEEISMGHLKPCLHANYTGSYEKVIHNIKEPRKADWHQLIMKKHTNP